MFTKSALHKPITGSVITIAIASVAAVTLVPTQSAQAIVVFDPSNYSQNILTAARALQQINNQIQALQNQTRSLLNQARNLETIDFPELDAISQTMRQIDQLMARAQGLQFKADGLEQQFQQLFPTGTDRRLSLDQQMLEAKTRLSTAMAAYQHTMSVQSQVVEDVAADAGTLNAIVAKSQGAAGALQAMQATNQLLALTAKQQFQIQQMMAAQYRSQAIEQARQTQAQSEAQSATTKFLGNGTAYSPR